MEGSGAWCTRQQWSHKASQVSLPPCVCTVVFLRIPPLPWRRRRACRRGVTLAATSISISIPPPSNTNRVALFCARSVFVCVPVPVSVCVCFVTSNSPWKMTPPKGCRHGFHTAPPSISRHTSAQLLGLMMMSNAM